MKLGAVLLLAAVAAASPDARYFRYERPVQNSAQAAGQSCLVLDAGIFAHAAPQLADLRLYRDGAETPYVIHWSASAQAANQSVAPLNLGRRGGQTVFDAAMPEGSYTDLQLAITGQDFIATVTVSGSQAQAGAAETKLGAFTIFDLTRQKLGRSTVLHLPESNFRVLHFRIAGPLLPESVTGLSVLRLPASKPKYMTVAESSRMARRDHSSLIEFTVPAHTPIDRIVFAPGAQPASFSRNVSVTVTPIAQQHATDAAEPPRPATTYGDILRVHRVQDSQRINEERLAVDAPEVDFNTAAKWTVAIDNGDDAPLQLDSVRLEMLERKLCFEAAGEARSTLYYGDPALAAPRYDYAYLFTPQADAAQAAAGPEQPNPAFQPRPDERPFTERHPALLWAVLVAVVALLGAIALRSAKFTGRTPP